MTNNEFLGLCRHIDLPGCDAVVNRMAAWYRTSLVLNGLAAGGFWWLGAAMLERQSVLSYALLCVPGFLILSYAKEFLPGFLGTVAELGMIPGYLLTYVVRVLGRYFHQNWLKTVHPGWILDGKPLVLFETDGSARLNHRDLPIFLQHLESSRDEKTNESGAKLMTFTELATSQGVVLVRASSEKPYELTPEGMAAIQHQEVVQNLKAIRKEVESLPYRIW